MDFPASIRVVLTSNDVMDGDANEPQSCPIALALRRMGFEAYVDSNKVDLARKGAYGLVSYDLSKPAVDFIHAFDSTEIRDCKKVRKWVETPPAFVLRRRMHR